jgi:hypothetical protein
MKTAMGTCRYNPMLLSTFNSQPLLTVRAQP